MTLDQRIRTAPPGLRDRIADRPLRTFVVLVLVLGYPLMALPVLAERGVIPGRAVWDGLGVAPDELAGLLLTALALLPAALFVTWAADGRAGLRSLGRRMLQWRVGPTWWGVVLLGLPGLSVAFALLLGDSVREVDPATVVRTQVIALLVNLLVVNLWEETAWAGVVQTRLERRHGLMVAALLTAVPFALVHMPLQFFDAVSPGSLLGAFAGLLVLGAVVRLLIGVVMRGVGGSVLAVAVLHSVFNRTNNDDGIVATLTDGDARGLGALLAAVVLTAALALVPIVRRR